MVISSGAASSISKSSGIWRENQHLAWRKHRKTERRSINGGEKIEEASAKMVKASANSASASKTPGRKMAKSIGDSSAAAAAKGVGIKQLKRRTQHRRRLKAWQYRKAKQK
jgi:hypothetical protein